MASPSQSPSQTLSQSTVTAPSFTVTETETPLITQPSPPHQNPIPDPTSKPDPTTDPTTKPDQQHIPISHQSFKEETNIATDLPKHNLKSLSELKQLIDNSSDLAPLSLWGTGIGTDSLLLKFLRAREFKPKDAFQMINDVVRWRKEFGADGLCDEDLGDDLERVVFMHGYDKVGHPVCYNVYGEIQDKELYENTFGDEEKRKRFLRWRVQFLEKSIKKLDFGPGGVCTIFQVSDLKNSPGPGSKELRIATKQALTLLQDNYPEFVAKQVFINVPWWYMAFYTMISPFLTQRTKSKFVFAGPAKTAETLYKYISAEQIPVQYGGLSVDPCDCSPGFTMDDPATEITIKPGMKQTVEIQVFEKCTLVWELRVVGWEVAYSAEFVPDDKNAYTVVLQKSRKMTPIDEPIVSQSFKVSELGKLMLVIDNPTAKKKKIVYRFIVNPF